MEIKLAEIVDAFLTNQLQDLEDSLFSLFAAYDIDAQEGVPLDKIADMVGLKIRSADTDTLRTFIKGQAAANVALGTFPDTEAIAQILLGSTAESKEYDAAILFQFEGTLTDDMRLIYIQLLKAVLPAGVAVIDVLAYNSTTARFDVSYFDTDYFA